MSVFNLSLDDFSPHPQAGLDFKVIEMCNKLIDKYPEVKIDLFVPTAYSRLNQVPCKLSQHQGWADKVKQLPDNYRLNMHGHYHRRFYGDHDFHRYRASNNDEFQHVTAEEAGVILKESKIEFAKSGLKHTNVIRPPAWKISVAAVQYLIRKGFFIAGNDEYYKKLKNYIPNLHKHWQKYNWDMIKKCNILKGDVFAFGHTSNWTNNYFDEERLEMVLELLSERKFEFKFIEEMRSN